MIDLIFNILNLLVFLFLLVYAFYKYLLPSIKISFYDHQLNITTLEDKKDELRIAQQALESEMLEQEKLCIILKNKIEIWSQSIDNVFFHRKNRYAQLKNKLTEKLNKQSENYRYEELKKTITPKLIESLTVDLEQHFKKEENRDLYFFNIFKALK